MTDIAIRATDLGKQYQLGVLFQYDSLRDSIMGTATGSRWRARQGRIPREANRRADFWALRDVSFEVRFGEVLGVIGRNGSGKSTLLKILSRITKPTEGRFAVSSHVASLLEVGTGFHRELTGRENIYMNGAILGMPKSEIRRKFDEIVEFSEVEAFLDTQVKHYSSGMSVRLAFAVAAHLDTEVLLIDEVLSVGDARFQRRCLNKMQDANAEGRTVLFVSHNMPSITRLCSRAILLDHGHIVADGPSSQVSAEYLGHGVDTMAHRAWPDPHDAPGDQNCRLRAVRVRSAEGATTPAVDIRRPVGIEVEFEVLVPGRIVIPIIQIGNEYGGIIFTAADQSVASKDIPRSIGRYRSVAWLPANFFSEGTVLVTVRLSGASRDQVYCSEGEAVAFQIVDTLDGDSARGNFSGHWPGTVRPLLPWTTEELPFGDDTADEAELADTSLIGRAGAPYPATASP